MANLQVKDDEKSSKEAGLGEREGKEQRRDSRPIIVSDVDAADGAALAKRQASESGTSSDTIQEIEEPETEELSSDTSERRTAPLEPADASPISPQPAELKLNTIASDVPGARAEELPGPSQQRPMNTPAHPSESQHSSK